MVRDGQVFDCHCTICSSQLFSSQSAVPFPRCVHLIVMACTHCSRCRGFLLSFYWEDLHVLLTLLCLCASLTPTTGLLAVTSPCPGALRLLLFSLVLNLKASTRQCNFVAEGHVVLNSIHCLQLRGQCGHSPPHAAACSAPSLHQVSNMVNAPGVCPVFVHMCVRLALSPVECHG